MKRTVALMAISFLLLAAGCGYDEVRSTHVACFSVKRTAIIQKTFLGLNLFSPQKYYVLDIKLGPDFLSGHIREKSLIRSKYGFIENSSGEFMIKKSDPRIQDPIPDNNVICVTSKW